MSLGKTGFVFKPVFFHISWHELGTHDLPSMIDFILAKTGQKKLYYMGHSQGTTMFFVMASELPDYNDKIQAMFALAPISFSSHMLAPVCQVLAKLTDQLHVSWNDIIIYCSSVLTKYLVFTQMIIQLIGKHEFKPTDEFMTKFTTKFCKENSVIGPICRNAIFIFTGFNKDQFDMVSNRVILQ